MPAVPRRGVPRLVSRPSVPAVVEQEHGGRAVLLVEIYLGYLVRWNEQGIDFLSAFEEDRGVFRLSHENVVVVEVVVSLDSGFSFRSFRRIVDSILIPLAGGIVSVLRC